MKKSFFAIAAILSFSFTSQAQIQPKHIFSEDLQSGASIKQEIDRFAGKYSSEGEKIGVLAFDISQKGTNIEGVANYSTFGKKAKKLTWTVNGYVKGGVAYIKFKDKKGSVVAEGKLNVDGEDTIIFKQTTSYGLIPRYSVLLR